MPLSVIDLLSCRFAPGQTGEQRFNAYKQLAAQVAPWSPEQKAQASAYRTCFLMRRALHEPVPQHLAALQDLEERGLDTSDGAVDSFIQKWGLCGRYPSYIRIPEPREDIFLDLWALTDIAVRYGLPEPDDCVCPPEAREWINWFGLQILARENGQPVIPTFYPVPGDTQHEIKSFKQYPRQSSSPQYR